MKKRIDVKRVETITDLISVVLEINKNKDKNDALYFRGENQDFGESAFQPSIYRSGFIENEHKIFREAQIYNQTDFSPDNSTFGKITRMQHFHIPTRMIDTSEDLLSALFFSFDGREYDDKKDDYCLYVLEIDKSQIKYYDSDSVSVVANLSKVPLANDDKPQKSKKSIINEALKNKKEVFNSSEAAKYLLHDIKEDKSYFTANIIPEDIFSVFFVKPQLNSQRISKQKGLALLFGLNKDEVRKCIPIVEKYRGDYELINNRKYPHPINKITKFIIPKNKINEFKDALAALGVHKHYIYPELEHVANYLKDGYKK